MTTVSRTEAQAIGLKCFFVGEPCGRGHIAERYVGNSNCTECWREYRRRLHYRRHYGVEYGEWTGAPPPKSDHERIIELEVEVAALKRHSVGVFAAQSAPEAA
jgi:hypothetical protein